MKNSHQLPKKLKMKISIAIPSSILENCQDLRQKTEKLGIIARACAIFKVENIFIYPHFFKDKKSTKNENLNFMELILKYLECPPYLRKRIFPLTPFLKYCGLLPPLKISHHLLKNKFQNLELGEFREGVIVDSNDKFSMIDVGFNNLFRLDIPKLEINDRLTVFMKESGSKIQISRIDPELIENYWGYRVYLKDLKEIIQMNKDCCTILTTKFGDSISKWQQKLLKEFTKKIKLIIVFGSPFEGLIPIIEKKGIKITNGKILKINMIPNQGTQTVTTEEAIFCTLSVINFLLSN